MTARTRRRKCLGTSVLAAAAAAALSSADLRAQTAWTNGGGTASWIDATNWDNGEPTAATDATLPTPIPAGGGTIALTPGRLANSLTADAAYTLNGGDLTLTTGDVTVVPSVTATINSTLTGGNGLTKLGTGTLVLGAANTYAGTTEVNAGTLRLGVNDALPTAGAVTIGTTGTTGSLGTTGTPGHLDLGNFDQTVAGLRFLSTATAATNTVTIAPGRTLTVNGAGSLKLGVSGLTGATFNATFAGGGALNVDYATANGTAATLTSTGSNTDGILDVGVRNANQDSTANNATLNLSALGSFTANVVEFRAGYDSRIGVNLTLSNTANTITATNVQIANSFSNNGTAATVTLGAGTNVINATTINVGAGKVGGTLKFAAQAAGSPGTLTVAGRTTGTTADINVGNSTSTDTSANFTATVDLRGHDVTVAAGTISLGRWTRTGNAGGATGTFSFDAGTVTANSLLVGTKSGNSTGVGNGNVNVGGGSLTVGTAAGTGAFTVASQAGNGTSTGVVTITGGTVTSNVDVRDGGGSATSTLTLDGGTLDLTGKRIGGTAAANNIDTLNLRSGTLRNVAEINNGGPLAKTTAGLFVLSGTNGYTGVTSIADGTLRVANAGALGAATSTADVTVADPGLLHLQAAAISDLATLRLTSTDATPEANLDYLGTDAVLGLQLNDVVLGAGVYGSTASGAANNNLIVAAGLNPNDFFAGGGTLTVAVPEPATAGLLAAAAAGLLARRRRVR